MQNQRHIVSLCQTFFDIRAIDLGSGAEGECACAFFRLWVQFQHGHAQFGGDFTSRCFATSGHDQGFGFQIAQVKLKLVGAVGHVQWCCGAGAGHSHECGGHLWAIGQHNADAVATANAHVVQGLHGVVDQGLHAGVAQGCG